MCQCMALSPWYPQCPWTRVLYGGETLQCAVSVGIAPLRCCLFLHVPSFLSPYPCPMLPKPLLGAGSGESSDWAQDFGYGCLLFGLTQLLTLPGPARPIPVPSPLGLNVCMTINCYQYYTSTQHVLEYRRKMHHTINTRCMINSTQDILENRHKMHYKIETRCIAKSTQNVLYHRHKMYD